MMHTYIQLPDGTHIGYGEPLADGTVKAAAVRFGEGGFSVALCTLPDCRWTEAQGYTLEELEALAGLLAGNAPLIVRLAQEAATAGETNAESDSLPNSPEAIPQPGAPAGRPADAPHAAAGAQQVAPPAQPASAAQAAPTAKAQGSPASGSVASRGAGASQPAQAARPQGAQSQEYQQAAAAMLDAASLVGRVVPGTRVGRLVNTAMPAARTVVAAAPGIVEKAAPVVSHAAEAAVEAAPKMAEKAARGIGRLGSKLAKAASGAVDSVVDGAKQAAENYHRESGR